MHPAINRKIIRVNFILRFRYKRFHEGLRAVKVGAFLLNMHKLESDRYKLKGMFHMYLADMYCNETNTELGFKIPTASFPIYTAVTGSTLLLKNRHFRLFHFQLLYKLASDGC